MQAPESAKAAPERVPASNPAEDAAILAKAVLAQAPETVGAPLAQDLDEAIGEIEAEQQGRRKSGGPEADLLQRSVADFVAGFDAQGAGDEETAYRHSFARQSQSEGERVRHLSFRVAAEEYAMALTQVRETIKVPAITEVPLTPPYVAGIISLRGTILPVIDLRKRLGLATEEVTRKSRILVAESEGRLVGLLVDEVRDVVEIRKDLIEPPPPVLSPAEAEFISGVGRASAAPGGKERVFILLNLANAARLERRVAA